MATAEARFFSKVSLEDECWIWSGALYWTGYGAFRNAEGRTITAHRWAYEFMVGEIPEGLHLDHLCRNRACVNPHHLDPVPQAVNNRRSRAGEVNRAIGFAKTHCKQGHRFTADNIRWVGPEKKYRQCRECSRVRNIESKRRLREARRA